MDFFDFGHWPKIPHLTVTPWMCPRSSHLSTWNSRPAGDLGRTWTQLPLWGFLASSASPLQKSLQESPTGQSSFLRGHCQPEFPSFSLWSLYASPLLAWLARKTHKSVTVGPGLSQPASLAWKLFCLDICLFDFSHSQLMLVSSHTSSSVCFALCQWSSFCMCFAVLHCPPAKVRSPRLMHIVVLVVLSPADDHICSAPKMEGGRYLFYREKNLRESDTWVRVCVIFSLHEREILSDLCCEVKHGDLITPLNSARNLTWPSAKHRVPSSLDHHLQRHTYKLAREPNFLPELPGWC